jgi:hypothetical protein
VVQYRGCQPRTARGVKSSCNNGGCLAFSYSRCSRAAVRLFPRICSRTRITRDAVGFQQSAYHAVQKRSKIASTSGSFMLSLSPPPPSSKRGACHVRRLRVHKSLDAKISCKCNSDLHIWTTSYKIGPVYRSSIGGVCINYNIPSRPILSI